MESRSIYSMTDWSSKTSIYLQLILVDLLRDLVFPVHTLRPPEWSCIISGLVCPDGDVVVAVGRPDTVGRV